MTGRVIGTRFDRRPRRNPERTHAAFLVNYFRDMSAFHGNSYTEGAVFDLHRTAIMKASLIHSLVERMITLVTIAAAPASNSDRRGAASRLHRHVCDRES